MKSKMFSRAVSGAGCGVWQDFVDVTPAALSSTLLKNSVAQGRYHEAQGGSQSVVQGSELLRLAPTRKCPDS